MKIKLFYLALIISSLSYGQYSFEQIDIWSGSNGSSPRYFTKFGGEMYFQAFDITPSFKKLYKTNGTTSGTQVIATNLNGGAGYSPESMYVMNGELFFTATVSGVGMELYKTDGTDVGTVLVKDVRTGSSNGMDSNTNDREIFAEYNGELYFRGNTDTSIQLWKTNGTEAGTVAVKDFGSGNSPNYIQKGETSTMGLEFDNALFFIMNNELWKTDGTEAGTVKVKENLSGIKEFIVFDGLLYFVAGTESTPTGSEIWVSDGTSSGTVLKFDIFPNDTQSSGFNIIGSNPRDLFIFNNELYFTAHGYLNNESTGRELWKSDGNSVSLVKDIKTGNNEDGINLPRFTVFENELYFRASDNTTSDFELWKTDGTENGTIKVVSVSDTGESIEFLHATEYDGKLFYFDSQQLWVTDGTSIGTEALTGNAKEIILISSFEPLVYQNKLWFSGTDMDNGNELTSLSSGTLSADEFKEEAFQLYPNPVTNELSIQLKGSLSIKLIKIYNVLGREIDNVPYNKITKKISMKNLDSGIYILFLESNEGRVLTKKIIKR
ncbi:T9SS type A sorting domain-containing protein [Pseudotenacibaculum haliotis]|uniref:T9SS type A sorting domain-containing protein n=1 Tax=Pseudotenacibaculum haliotis TaxID=1862138 RepID=A0ABW5LMC3_9FLAO